ncbi:hypothetical protein BGZ51_000239 [Haplosporangium sp. Z 767]|nr:hypothetical protein BGZ51_000239 [Haplosporangium sp. Z 767]
MRNVLICDPDTKLNVALPDVHHGFPLHVCFLRDQVLSVTLDGQISFFQKGDNYRLIRSCTVGTKVYQIVAANFGTRTFERQDQDGTTISWGEVICLAHEYGVTIKDEHAHTLCEIHVDLGAMLLQIQAIADDSPPYRNELLILFEDPNTRQRKVLCVKMAPGFEREMSREVLNPGFSLGRGGDARDSIAMYRDRIGIVSHRNCSSDLGHYCVLRLMDVKNGVVVSTEYAQYATDDHAGLEEEEDDEEEEKVEDSDKENERETREADSKVNKIQLRGKSIHLNDFAGQKAACRILAMDHARIVLGMGPRIVKVLCLI